MKTVVEVETERLESANRHIVAVEDRIQSQRRRIANLVTKGVQFEHSEKLLASLVDTLGVMQKYRQQVIYHLVEARLQQQDLQRRILQNPESEK